MPSFRASDYEYADLPEDTPLLCKVTSIEEQKNPFAGRDEKASPTQLQIDFEIIEGEFKGERIRTWMNPTLGPKANLTKLACAVMNVEYTKEMEVDTDQLVHKHVYVLGDYGDDGKSSFLKPRKYKPASGTSNNRRGRRQDSEEKPQPAGVAAGGNSTSKDDDLDF